MAGTRLSFLAPRPMKLDAEEAQKWAQEPRPPVPPKPPVPPMPPMPPMPGESPRPGESSLEDSTSDHAAQAHLLEELAQVEHQLEALAEYRKQLREKIQGMEVGDAG